MKDRKDVIVFLKHLTNEMFGKMSRVWNFNPFPLLIIQTGYLLTLKIFQLADFSNSVNLKYLKDKVTLREILLFLRGTLTILFKHKRKFSRVLKSKVLLFGFVEHNGIHPKWGNINLYTEPYRFFLNREGVFSENLFLSRTGISFTKNNFNFLYQLLVSYYTVYIKIENLLSFGRAKKRAFSNAVWLKEFLDRNNVEHSDLISSNFYNIQIEQYIQFKTFVKFLKITKPKSVWTYCYYDNIVMGLVRAANLLKIPITEYQHSSQSDDHFAYAEWKNIDEYMDFFPMKFWVWNEQDKERILKNFTGSIYKPSVINGGNLLLREALADKQENIISNNVLICLQGNWIPLFLENFITKDTKYQWYIRSHPRYQGDLKLLNDFASLHSEKIKIANSQTTSLYEVARKMSYNITAYSGTALEVAELGVQNIIIGEDGYNAYHKKIEDDVFYFAEDEESLRQALARPRNFTQSFFEDDNVFQKKILSTLRN